MQMYKEMHKNLHIHIRHQVTSADEAEDRDAVVFVENAEGTEYLTKG